MWKARIYRFLSLCIVVFMSLILWNSQGNTGQLRKKVVGKFNKFPAFAVVELFTSEGCSSCPPADRVLSRLLLSAKRKGQRVFPLAFHVDYWNNLGWKDLFSRKAFTKRQRRYATHFGDHKLYTPQMIVNGKARFIGSDQVRARKELTAALKHNAAVEVKLSAYVLVASKKIVVNYDVSTKAKGAFLHIALVERGLVSNVKAGENAGRSLLHDNVVRAFSSRKLEGKHKAQMTLHLPENVVIENASLIGYVQMPSSLKIIGAQQTEISLTKS